MHGSYFSNNLNYFTALYETLDYTIAARKLRMSYQGLRKAMLKLEQDLELELFAHDEDGHLRPTEYAEALYEQVQQWDVEAIQLEDRFKVIAEKSRKAIYVGFANGTLPFMGFGLVTEFEQEFPHLTLRIVEEHGSVIDQSLHDGDYPFAMTTGPFDDDFELVEVVECKPLVWLNRSHPKARRSTLTLADLSHETVFTLTPEENFAKASEEMINNEAARVTYVHVSNPFWLLTNVIQGFGIGIGIDWLDHALGNQVDIASVPLESNLRWHIGLVKRKDIELSADQRLALDFLRSRLQEHKGEDA